MVEFEYGNNCRIDVGDPSSCLGRTQDDRYLQGYRGGKKWRFNEKIFLEE